MIEMLLLIVFNGPLFRFFLALSRSLKIQANQMRSTTLTPRVLGGLCASRDTFLPLPGLWSVWREIIRAGGSDYNTHFRVFPPQDVVDLPDPRAHCYRHMPIVCCPRSARSLADDHDRGLQMSPKTVVFNVNECKVRGGNIYL